MHIATRIRLTFFPRNYIFLILLKGERERVVEMGRQTVDDGPITDIKYLCRDFCAGPQNLSKFVQFFKILNLG